MEYYELINGESFVVPLRGFSLMCCDCGLVHDVKIEVFQRRGKKRIRISLSRDERATGQARRKRGKKTREDKNENTR